MSVSYAKVVLKEIENLTGLLSAEKQKRQTAAKLLPTLNVMEGSHTVDNLQSQYSINYQPPRVPSHALQSKGAHPSKKNIQQPVSVLKRRTDIFDNANQQVIKCLLCSNKHPTHECLKTRLIRDNKMKVLKDMCLKHCGRITEACNNTGTHKCYMIITIEAKWI